MIEYRYFGKSIHIFFAPVFGCSFIVLELCTICELDITANALDIFMDRERIPMAILGYHDRLYPENLEHVVSLHLLTENVH